MTAQLHHDQHTQVGIGVRNKPCMIAVVESKINRGEIAHM